MKSGPMLTTMIMRWRVLTEPCQRFPKMRFWPGYLSRSRTTSGCSVSRFLEHILDVFLICDLKKKVSVWTWSCLSELFLTNLKETTYWNICLLSKSLHKAESWESSFQLSLRFLVTMMVIPRLLTVTPVTSSALALTTCTRPSRSRI